MRRHFIVWVFFVPIIAGLELPKVGNSSSLPAAGPQKSRICSDSRCLRASLLEPEVEEILLRGSLTVTSEWTEGGIVTLASNRSLTLRAENLERLATLDLGMQPSLILLQPNSKLNFTRVAITNIAVRGPASLQLPLFLPTFPLWPSITAYPNATVVYQGSLLYWWSMLPDYNCTADVEKAEQTLEGGWGHQYVHQVSTNVLIVTGSHNFTTAVNQVSFSGKGSRTEDNVGDIIQNVVNSTGMCMEPPKHLRIPSAADAASSGALPISTIIAIVVAFVAVLLMFILGFCFVYRLHRQPQRWLACCNLFGGPKAGSEDVEGGGGTPGSSLPPSQDHAANGSFRSEITEVMGTGSLGSLPPAASFGQKQSHMVDVAALIWSRSGILKENLEIGPIIGKGSYGRVYKAKWNGVIVAVKVVEHDPDLGNALNTLLESTLAQSINHPNLVHLYQILKVQTAGSTKSRPPDNAVAKRGAPADSLPASAQGPNPTAVARKPSLPQPVAVANGGSPNKELGNVGARESEEDLHVAAAVEKYVPQMEETWMVFEYCGKGTLHNAMKSGWLTCKDSNQPNMKVVLACLKDVAFGMSHLHMLGVLHGDLKPANVLLKAASDDPRRYICKLGDFGLSRVLGDQASHINTHTYGTISFMPPELVRDAKLSKASDVYSFGILMWELYCRETAFDGIPAARIFYMIAVDNERPPVPDDMPQEYRALMESCWATRPDDRPTFSQVLARISSLYEQACQREGGSSEQRKASRTSPKATEHQEHAAQGTQNGQRGAKSPLRPMASIKLKLSSGSSGEVAGTSVKGSLSLKAGGVPRPSLRRQASAAMTAFWNLVGPSPGVPEGTDDVAHRVHKLHPQPPHIPQVPSCPGYAGNPSDSSDSAFGISSADSRRPSGEGSAGHAKPPVFPSSAPAGAAERYLPSSPVRAPAGGARYDAAGAGTGAGAAQAAAAGPFAAAGSGEIVEAGAARGPAAAQPLVAFKSPFQAFQWPQRPSQSEGDLEYASRSSSESIVVDQAQARERPPLNSPFEARGRDGGPTLSSPFEARQGVKGNAFTSPFENRQGGAEPPFRSPFQTRNTESGPTLNSPFEARQGAKGNAFTSPFENRQGGAEPSFRSPFEARSKEGGSTLSSPFEARQGGEGASVKSPFRTQQDGKEPSSRSPFKAAQRQDGPKRVPPLEAREGGEPSSIKSPFENRHAGGGASSRSPFEAPQRGGGPNLTSPVEARQGGEMPSMKSPFENRRAGGGPSSKSPFEAWRGDGDPSLKSPFGAGTGGEEALTPM